MQTILPDAVRLDIAPNGDGFDLCYEEDFGGMSKEVAARTLEAFNAMALPGVKTEVARGRGRRPKTTITITGTKLARERVGAMMAMEFFGWSRIGSMAIRDVMIAAMLGGRT